MALIHLLNLLLLLLDSIDSRDPRIIRNRHTLANKTHWRSNEVRRIFERNQAAKIMMPPTSAQCAAGWHDGPHSSCPSGASCKTDKKLIMTALRACGPTGLRSSDSTVGKGHVLVHNLRDLAGCVPEQRQDGTIHRPRPPAALAGVPHASQAN